MDSGLAHHLHRNGQPFKKTVVLIPGPSCRENLCMSKIKPFKGSNSRSLKRLGCSGYYVVLQPFRYINKVCTVPRHPYDQIRIPLWMFLRLNEGVPIHSIELYMPPAKIG